MKFDEYWNILMTMKPIKDGQSITMSKEQFKKMQKQAYEKGANQKSIFESIFG